ncbi:MAG: MFS transporter [Ruminococcus sp.]|uniref:MFS transporter n=1 Tax=Ruminococcus sp. TaxID=41978 RepID=UPI003995188F
MEQKKLPLYTKVFYGMGDFASNYVITFIAFFIMIYLTDSVGLNSAIVGTLMFAAKFVDGISDVIFGALIDRTHTKWGKAKPWMFVSTFPLCLFLVLEFMIPNTKPVLQYAYFFVVYTLINSIFYTANNIAYATLSALITKNQQERVQLGTIRFIFAFSAMLCLSMTTTGLVEKFGGGVSGWRTVAVIYAIFALIVNTISCVAVKELPEDTDDEKGDTKKKASLKETFSSLVHNKYFLMILVLFVAMYISTSIISGAGVYYATYVLGNPGMFGIFSMAVNVPMIVSLFFVPVVVKKLGIYKTNLYGGILTVLAALVTVYAGFTKNIPVMFVGLVLRSVFNSSLMGTVYTWIADVAGYSWRKDGIHIEGSVFSCASVGNKVGSGLGSAVIGWLLAAGGYVAASAAQPQSAVTMITIIYTVVPTICFMIIGICCFNMKVEKANKKWDEKHANN